MAVSRRHRGNDRDLRAAGAIVEASAVARLRQIGIRSTRAAMLPTPP
jgi:hypothetical protein